VVAADHDRLRFMVCLRFRNPKGADQPFDLPIRPVLAEFPPTVPEPPLKRLRGLAEYGLDT
jgi:hypothetical protein